MDDSHAPFFATTINYLDPQVIRLLKPTLEREFSWTGVVRAVLGLGEAGNFPTAINSVAEWFPKKEQATATGIFNSGANIRAVVAPIMVS